MKKQTFYLLLCMVSGLLMAGCGENNIYEERIEIPDASWTYENPLAFSFEIADTSKRYDILLEVEHAADYGYQNLYVQFHTHFPSGNIESQVVSLELATRSGIWQGDCSGNTCDVEIPLQLNAIFNEPGPHKIVVEQYMRKSPLPGVIAMEIELQESE